MLAIVTALTALAPTTGSAHADEIRPLEGIVALPVAQRMRDGCDCHEYACASGSFPDAPVCALITRTLQRNRSWVGNRNKGRVLDHRRLCERTPVHPATCTQRRRTVDDAPEHVTEPLTHPAAGTTPAVPPNALGQEATTPGSNPVVYRFVRPWRCSPWTHTSRLADCDALTLMMKEL
ncbi:MULTISPECIES: hypothetical protein [unclassified Streptomyces]|uniref:hypothetical protein n=2 Tax=Streptomyces TaxID=1883 RepID=UPI0033B5F2D9